MAKKQKKRAEKGKMKAKPAAGKYGNNILLKVKDVLLNPNNFFEKIKKEGDFYAAFLYFLAINLLVLGLWRVSFLSAKLSMRHPGFSSMMGGSNFWLAWVPIRVIGMFVMAYILHTCVKLFTRKSHNFIDSFNVLIYGETPYALFGWLSPIIFGVWSIALYVKGAMKIYDFSVLEAACVLALTVLLGTIVMALGSMIVAMPFIG